MSQRKIIIPDALSQYSGSPLRRHRRSSLDLNDDYCRETPGYCYLLPFYNRSKVLEDLGEFPLLTTMLTYIQIHKISISNFAIYKTSPTTLHVTFEDGLTRKNFISHATCRLCSYKHNEVATYYPNPCQNCPRCNVKLFLTVLPYGDHNMRVGYDLESLSYLRGKSGYPNEYSAEVNIKRKLTVSRQDDDILIYINDHAHNFNCYSNKLKAMRHNYIASLWETDTDMKLSTLGIQGLEGQLTPDFIDVPNRIVIELATVNTNKMSMLHTAYNNKRIKYSYIFENTDIKFYIVVVGRNSLLTDLLMTSEIYKEFMTRFIEIYPLESRINMLMGKDIFRDDLSESFKFCKLTFDKSDFRPLKSKSFDPEWFSYFSEPITNGDKEKTRRILIESLDEAKVPYSWKSSDVDKYLSKFTTENSKITMTKRICNIPLIISEGGRHIGCTAGEAPSEMKTLWNQSLSIMKDERDPTEELKRMINNDDSDISHLNKKLNTFSYSVTQEEKQELAKIGIHGKEFDSYDFKKDIEKESHKSLHPSSNTEDISRFIQKKQLLRYHRNIFIEQLSTTVRESKDISTGVKDETSKTIWKNQNDTLLLSFCYQMSYLFMELSYNYKQWTSGNRMIRRDLNHGISIILYNPKGHLFVSYAFPKSSIMLETGRLGPSIYDVGTHFITDFCSYNECVLEHFIKFGPYINSLLIHLKSNYELDPTDQSDMLSQTINNILLLYMNNKLDTEELITSQRYLFMKLLEDVQPNPYGFVDRFPEVIRSRLTVYYLWRTISLMNYYDSHKITKIPTVHDSMIIYEYKNIKSLFHDCEINLNQKVNEFYFGYVISKERGRGNNRMFKVLTKILENEYQFRDSSYDLLTSSYKVDKFMSNKHLLKVFSQTFSSLIQSKLGEDYKEKLYSLFLQKCSSVTFGDLSTLKASSRDHSKKVELSEFEENESLASIMNQLKNSNKEEYVKRPKMLEAMIDLVKRYTESTKKTPYHVVELLPWCLNNLLMKGYFDSDCFAKPQHGGDREIHVLEADARIVQFFIELFSKTVCELFPSETTCTPESKDKFVKSHYTKAKDSLKTFNTHSKSADASKWCQAHHVSHFAAMFESILPDQLKSFMLSALSLWPKKRISFPMELTAVLLKNKNVQSSDLFSRFRSDFYSGSGIFTSKMSNCIEIQSGMFQGILHRTSSLYHTMIQEVMKQYVHIILNERLCIPSVVSVIQGSDDSGMMISFKGNLSNRFCKLAKTLLSWKEKVASRLSVYTNDCKTSTGTHDLIEYNSEWHSRHKLIKPTFRWISACLELSVTERFIDRIRIFNNVLTQCLEGGSSTLESAVVQLNQASLHYMLLGFLNQATTSSIIWDNMKTIPDPIYGFFPCDFDITAGVTGVEFQLFTLYKNTKYGGLLKNNLSIDVDLSYVPDEIPNFLKTKDLQQVSLKFTNMQLYKSFLSRIELNDMSYAIAELDKNPELLYRRNLSWEDEKLKLILKIFSPGVKESLSNMSSTLRMAASSAYLQSMKCFTIRGVGSKFNLYNIIREIQNEYDTKLNEDMLFPLSDEFNSVLSSIKDIRKSGNFQSVTLKRTSKSPILVFESSMSKIPLMNMCKRQWFGMKSTPLSNNQFKSKWLEICDKYKFISTEPGIQGHDKTRQNLHMNSFECKSFIDSFTSKFRRITLYDSHAKTKNLQNAITRIYWPNIKIVTSISPDSEINVLRSKIFSISTYWNDPAEKILLIKNLLLESKILSQSIDAIPPRGKKLKIFRDYLSSIPKTTMISDILELKRGIIGCFVQRQKGFGNTRSGKGIWIGRIGEVEACIHIEGSECVKLIINKLTDTIQLGSMIINLLNEFCCTIRVSNKSNLFMTPEGKFSSNTPGLEVLMDPELKFEYADDLERYRWNLILDDTNVKLTVWDMSNSKIQDLTILSDSFTSKDWLAETPLQTDDIILKKWSVGEPISGEDLLNQLQEFVPSSRNKFLMMMKIFSSDRKNNYKFNSIRKTLMSMYRVKIKSASCKDNSSDDDNIDITDIYDQVMSFTFDDHLDLTTPVLDWSEEKQNDDDMLLYDFNNGDLDDINDLSLMLKQTEDENLYEDLPNKSRTMPSATKFFTNLNMLSVSIYNKSFSELLSKCTENDNICIPGLLGLVISIILRQYRYIPTSQNEHHISDMEIQATILSDSLTDDQKLYEVNKSDVQNRILAIDNLMIESPEDKRDELNSIRNKYKRILSIITEEKVPYKDQYNEILSSVVNLVNRYSLKFSDFLRGPQEVMKSLLETLLVSSLNEIYNTFSVVEKSRIDSAIKRKVMNVEMANLLKLTYENNELINNLFMINE